MRAVGIDVSLWQDDNSTPQMVDFHQSRRAGVSFAFMKASQGTFADPDFVMNWQHAAEAGLPRGAYHFFTWDVSVSEQARFFAGLLKNNPGELPPVLDFEMRKYAPADQLRASCSAKIFLMEVEQILGVRPMLYTSPSYWKEFGAADDITFLDYPLWIAHYYVDAPKVPAPWKTWTFWQWSTGKGLGPHYGAESKDIDLNVFNGTEANLRERFGLSALPLPEPKPIPPGLRMRVITDGLRIRKGPGTQFPIVGTLKKDQLVEIHNAAGPKAWGQVDPLQDLWACVEADGVRHMLIAEEGKHAA